MRRAFALVLIFVVSCSARSGQSLVAPAEFAIWAPERRVGYLVKNGFYTELGNTLIANGTDAAPALARVIRHGSTWDAVHAADVLCQMDRYVPASDAPLPDFAIRIKVPSLQIAGRINTAIYVDGRRIGPEGLNALRWASHESDNQLVRTAAQGCSGEMHSRFAVMPIPDLLPLWEKLIKRCFHLTPCNTAGADEATLNVLNQVLAERAPESLDALAQFLTTTNNGWVIESAEWVLEGVDVSHFRVAENESGKRLIAAISVKLAASNPARLFPRGLLQGGFTPEHEMQVRREQLARLNKLPALVPRYIPSIVAFIAYAHLQRGPDPVWERDPEIRAFVLHLSTTHPDFPSWEYVASSVDEEILNPRFEIKMQRFMDEWSKFVQMPAGGEDEGGPEGMAIVPAGARFPGIRKKLPFVDLPN